MSNIYKWNKPIYMIMVCTKIEEKVYEHVETDGTTSFKPSGYPEFGVRDVVGFYHDKEDAIRDVEWNACDINETMFKYAIIEEVYPGIYPCSRTRWIFEYDRDSDTYYQINEPEILKKMMDVTLG